MQAVIPVDSRGRLVTPERLTANRDINEKDTPGVFQLAGMLRDASHTADGLGFLVARVTAITKNNMSDFLAGAQRTIECRVNGVTGAPLLSSVPCLSSYTPYVGDSCALLSLPGDQGYLAIASVHSASHESFTTGGGTTSLRGTTSNPNMGSNGYDYYRTTMIANGIGFVQHRWGFGTNGSGAATGLGQYYFLPQLGIRLDPTSLLVPFCGGGYMYDSSANIVWNVQVRQTNVGGVNGLFMYNDGHVAGGYTSTNTSPFSVSFGDEFGIYALVEYS